MRASVSEAFVRFSTPLEGALGFMYLDQLGLVTTSIGVLVHPLPLALGLPWIVPGEGRTATRQEVAEDWERVHERQDLRMRGGATYAQVARLRLAPGGIELVARRKLDDMVAKLRRRFDEWDQWPADAQLAVLSLAWACGPAFRFPKLAGHLQDQDWRAAATETDIRPDHGTIRKRNEWMRQCYENAARCYDTMGDRERLWWPEAAPAQVLREDRAGGGMLAIEGVAEGVLAAREDEPRDDLG